MNQWLRLDRIKIFMYLILIIEIIVFFVLRYILIVLIQIGLISIAGGIYIYTSFFDKRPVTNDFWIRLRKSIAQIFVYLEILSLEEEQLFRDVFPLSKGNKISVASVGSNSDATPNYMNSASLASEQTYNRDEARENFAISFRTHVSMDILTKEELMNNLRTIGVDGTLILLLLIKNDNSAITIKTMQNFIGIPQSTLYRTMEKLMKRTLVDIKASMDDPGVNYYIINYNGEVLLRTFYQTFWK